MKLIGEKGKERREQICEDFKKSNIVKILIDGSINDRQTEQFIDIIAVKNEMLNYQGELTVLGTW